MCFVRHLCIPVILPALLSVVISSQTLAIDPPARIGRVSFLGGSVSFRASGTDDWAAAALNYPVTTGDELWSPAGARAEVHVGSSAVRLDSRTLVDFLAVSDHDTRLQLTQGSLYVRVRDLQAGDSYEVDIPGGALRLLDPGHYRIDVSPDRGPTRITVRDGQARISTDNGPAVAVDAGETVSLSGPDSPASIITTVAVDDWEHWCAARDRQDDTSVSLRYLSPEWVGFEDLDGYGSWVVDESIGPIWMPTVPAGWAPYRFGSWEWVAPWGWTWIDDAPWGFAPCHYGRWAFRRGRWGWVPGERARFPVYAPALVAFVGGSGFDLSLGFGAGRGLGWFPLAPGEAYVPAYRVSPTYIRNVNMTSVNIRRIDVTKIDITKARYANRSVPGAVTAVSRETFLKGGEVGKATMRVSPAALARATVVGTTASVAPTRESLTARAAGHRGEAPPAPAAHGSVIKSSPKGGRVPATTRRAPAGADLQRQWQAEREQVLARQAAERTELERRQQQERSAPPVGVSQDDLRERQARERDALAQRHREETKAIDDRYRRQRR